MESKSLNSDFRKDQDYGQQPMMFTTTPDLDQKNNIDCVLGSLKIALRRRRISIKRYGELSIRYKRTLTGTKTELAKILDGDNKADLYIFEFTDCWVLCTLQEIKRILEENKYHVVQNNDMITQAAYINIKDIKNLLIIKN